MSLNRRAFLTTLAAAALAPRIAWGASPTLGPTLLQEFDYGQVRLQGLARQQFEQCRTLLMGLSEDSLLFPFRDKAGLPTPGTSLSGWYAYNPDYHPERGDEVGFAPGHCFGQWVSALARAYAIEPDEEVAAKVRRLTKLYGETISPKFHEAARFNGYTYDKILLGLLDARRWVKDDNALAIIEKATDTVLPFLPPRALDHGDELQAWSGRDGSYGWDETYTMAENLYLAYRRGAGERYLKLARRFLKDDTYFDPLALGHNVLPNHHAYSYTNAISSAMAAYLTEGSSKHLQAAKNAFRMIETTQSYATGGWGPDETFREPGKGLLGSCLHSSHASFEAPCGGYAHFKLTRALLRVTGDTHYGDSMERVLYNTVLGVLPMQSDGHAFYYSDCNFNARKVYSLHAWPCCAGTLPQLAADYHISTYLRSGDGVHVNLYLPSAVKFEVAGVPVTLTQQGNYPLEEEILFTVNCPHPVEFPLHLRIPEWTEGAWLKGPQGHQKAEAGGWATVTRRWQNGEQIRLQVPMPLRLESVDAQNPELVALLRGPLVLMPLHAEPAATQAALLKAERVGTDSWRVGDYVLKPYFAIHDETYSTYWHTS